jgi:TrmH family RNA methyltransferase
MVIRSPDFSLDYWKLQSDALYLVVEGVEKPGNIGAMLRTADAVGCHGVILCNLNTDLTNPNVVRSSLGTLFSVNAARVESKTAMSWLLERGVSIAAATPTGDTNYTQVPLGHGPVAVVVGNEHQGLSLAWLENAHLKVKIPMRGLADSLNVAFPFYIDNGIRHGFIGLLSLFVEFFCLFGLCKEWSFFEFLFGIV